MAQNNSSAPRLPSVLFERSPARIGPTLSAPTFATPALLALPSRRQGQQPMAQRRQRIARQVPRHDPVGTDTLLVTVFGSRIVVRQREQRRGTTGCICHGNEVQRIVAQILERV